MTTYRFSMSQPYFPESEIPMILDKFGNILKGNDILSQGKFVHTFENEFAKYSQCQHAVATNSCSAALEIVLRTLQLNFDDEVIVPVETFIATGSAIIREGGKPIFAGINPDTFCLSLNEIKRLHTKKTKAVIIVHMAGFVTPEIKSIQSYCKQHGLFLIEDAAHSPGAEFDGQRAGSFGDCGCFSFYPTKVITTGEGGMVVTNNEALYKQLNAFRHRGRDLDSENEEYSMLGSNNRMTEIAAILGLSQLNHLDEFIEQRNKIALTYKKHLVSAEAKGWIKTLDKPDNSRHSYWRFIVKLHSQFNRNALKNLLQTEGIPIDWAYSPPLHLQPLFKKLYNITEGYLAETEETMQHFFCLPIHSRMTEDDSKFVAEKLLLSLHKMIHL